MPSATEKLVSSSSPTVPNAPYQATTVPPGQGEQIISSSTNVINVTDEATNMLSASDSWFFGEGNIRQTQDIVM